VSFLLELEGILRGQARLTYGQVVLVGFFGAFVGCGFFAIQVAPRAETWWGPLLALAPGLVWLGAAVWCVKLMAAFKSPFRPVEAYRSKPIRNQGRAE